MKHIKTINKANLKESAKKKIKKNQKRLKLKKTKKK